jgi:hypothetical protein
MLAIQQLFVIHVALYVCLISECYQSEDPQPCPLDPPLPVRGVDNREVASIVLGFVGW